ncbi:MAG TPA: ATP-binding protein [Longimicrobiales bacterium]|nr:ATP-binding protein [Longimicrobiales bacterium]
MTDRLALAGALIAVAGLVVVNWVIVGRTERLRTSILAQSESVRALSDSVAFTVAHQAINLQAYLLTGDPSHLDEYEAARLEGDTLVARLEVSAREFGSITNRNFGTVVLLRDAWQERHDEVLSEVQPREAALAQVDEERARVLDLLAVISDLAGVAQLSGAERRAAIVRIYRAGALVTALMALLAIASVSSAYIYRQRLYVRSEDARMKARQLEQALEERQEILAIVSHDLRNSLNVVVASIALVREPGLPEKLKAKQLRVAERTSAGMTRLISDLLDASTLDAGHLTIERRAVEPGRLVVDTVDAWTQKAVAREVTLQGNVAEGLEPVFADPERILQVLGNLVGNALKFTPESGSVELTASAVDGAVRFQVEDTGPGIPAEHLPRIFDRYYQVRSSRRAGAGLGLAIARGIVEAHGSSLEVLTWAGRGTRFWFDLPVAPAEPRRLDPPPGADHSSEDTTTANQPGNGPAASAG